MPRILFTLFSRCISTLGGPFWCGVVWQRRHSDRSGLLHCCLSGALITGFHSQQCSCNARVSVSCNITILAGMCAVSGWIAWPPLRGNKGPPGKKSSRKELITPTAQHGIQIRGNPERPCTKRSQTEMFAGNERPADSECIRERCATCKVNKTSVRH